MANAFPVVTGASPYLLALPLGLPQASDMPVGTAVLPDGTTINLPLPDGVSSLNFLTTPDAGDYYPPANLLPDASSIGHGNMTIRCMSDGMLYPIMEALGGLHTSPLLMCLPLPGAPMIPHTFHSDVPLPNIAGAGMIGADFFLLPDAADFGGMSEGCF